MKSDRAALARMAGTVAQEYAEDMASRLILTPAPPEWPVGISSKATSIVENEVVPLIPPDASNHDRVQLVRAVGEILGIAYLADYALEAHIAYRIDDASDHVVDIARSIGAHDEYVRAQLRPLRDLFEYECRGAHHTEDFMRRYFLNFVP